ncbi:MAG: 16S rRNA (guanine(966)-N(2))-methyltransferase RsmD [Ignavibacteria bacterium]|nr:16S rRNA (guanine(966)-N(2))-methyltransferase RsmD [Ignavibacteria bacterium]
MRIISGEYKGRIITTSVPHGVRPTTDQARETIFNILAGYVEWEEVSVLDLCAGTGALGFEALSRGAKHCDFVELNRTTARQIEETALKFSLESYQYKVHCMDCLDYLRNYQDNNKVMVIFTDPPYLKKLLNRIVSLIDSQSILDEGIVVAEHDAHEVVLPSPNFNKFSSRKFGETIVDFYQYSRID